MNKPKSYLLKKDIEFRKTAIAKIQVRRRFGLIAIRFKLLVVRLRLPDYLTGVCTIRLSDSNTQVQFNLSNISAM